MRVNWKSFALRYGLAVAIIALAISGRLLMAPLLGDQFPFAIPCLGILIAARFGGFGPAVAAVILGGIAADYFLIPPRGGFMPTAMDGWVGLLLYAGTGFGIAFLGSSMPAGRARAEAGATTTRREGRPDDPESGRKHLATERKVQAGFVFALLCLAATSMIAFESELTSTRQADLTRHTAEVIGQLRHLLTITMDAETAQRGFILTGDKHFLDPYNKVHERVAEVVKSLRQLTADNPGEQHQLNLLEPVIATRLAETDTNIELRRTGGFAKAQAAVASSRGRVQQDQIRTMLAEMEGVEQSLLAQRQATARQGAFHARLFIAGSCLLAFGVVLAALFLIQQDFARARLAEVALNEAKEQLETRVRERTAELALSGKASERSEARLAGIVESAMDAILSVDSAQKIVLFNAAAEKLFGWPATEALGQALDRFIPPRFHERHRQHVAVFGQSGATSRSMHSLGALMALRADGTEFPIEASISQIEVAGEKIYTVILRDLTERQRAEAGVALLAAIVHSSDDAIIGKNLDGIVTSWNSGAEKLFGYRADEMVGQPIRQLIPPEHRQEEEEILTKIRHGESIQHFDNVRRRKDGGMLAVSVTVSPIKDATGKIIGISKVARDISEHKQMAAEIRASEEKFRTLANSMPQLAWMARADGFIHWYNQRWYEYTGTTPEQMAGWGWQTLHDPAMLPKVMANWTGAITAGRPFEMEFPLRGADGQFRMFLTRSQPLKDAAGKVTQWFGTNTDITVQKEAENKLRDQLTRLALLDQITRAISERLDFQSILQAVIRNLEDNLPADFCCVCLHDEPAKTFKVAQVGVKSEALARELAMPEHAVIPMDGNGLSHCALGQLVYEPDVREMKYPFPQRLAGSGLRSLVIAPLPVAGKVTGFLMVARCRANSFVSGECEFLKQLTEHVGLAAQQAKLHSALQAAYDDLQRTQQAAVQQERLRAFGQMASGIAHDINNAITPVMLYTELLLDDEPTLSARAREYIEAIKRSTHDVAATIARMREFYRQRPPQLTLAPIHLNVLAQQVLDLTRVRWSDGPQAQGLMIRTQVTLEDNLPEIMGVESEIRDALVNLIFNAVDAMAEGGTLTLRTVTKPIAPEPGGTTAARQVWLELTDTGKGMDDETRRRCLEPFFTTKGERGTGLGLAMVYGMIKRHSAGIEIDSTPGKGTTVRLLFPVSAMVADEVSPPPTAIVLPAHLRILFIDDDPLLIQSIGDSLSHDGHTVVTATGGQEGIHAFMHAQERQEPFAVVITDLGMPYVDGRKVASAVKAASPSTPVIMLTGWGQRLEAEGDVPVQVDRLLSKPPRLRDLREALAACCPVGTLQPTKG